MPIRGADIERIRALPLFASVSESVFRNIIGGAFLQRFPAGTTLLMEGDNVDFLYVLLEGSVELGGSWHDKDTVLAILRPISTFILASVVLDAESLMSAHTIERSAILMLSGEALRRAMKQDACMACLVAEELSGGYTGVVRALKNQKLRGGVERLASYLVSLQARLGGPETFDLPHEKRVVASLLGMTPENLSRALVALGNYGVEVNGRQVTVSRPVALERLAKPDPLVDNLVRESEGDMTQADFERRSAAHALGR
jgi:CRP/FNR family transcriptional activator FtrB